MAAVGGHLVGVKVETDRLHLLAEFNGEGQAYVAEADNCDCGHEVVPDKNFCY
jgi:hypothetical protein